MGEILHPNLYHSIDIDERIVHRQSYRTPIYEDWMGFLIIPTIALAIATLYVIDSYSDRSLTTQKESKLEQTVSNFSTISEREE